MTDHPRNGDRPEQTFDETLQRELDRAEFAGEGQTIEGEILGTDEWVEGEDITLRVAIPFEADSPFTEDLELPPPDKRLGTTKFGRLLTDLGYSRSQAEHIVGETVECTYNGEWTIVDPKFSVSTSEADIPSTADDTSGDDGYSARIRGKGKRVISAIRDGPVKGQVGLIIAAVGGLCFIPIVLGRVDGVVGAATGVSACVLFYIGWSLMARYDIVAPRFECGAEEIEFVYRGVPIIMIINIHDEVYGPSADERMRMTRDVKTETERRRYRKIVARAYPDGGEELSVEDEELVRRDFGLLSPLTTSYRGSRSTDNHRVIVEERMKRKIDREYYNTGIGSETDD